jgi:hypothetical protein
LALAAGVGAPAVATAGPHGGGHHGGSHGGSHHGGSHHGGGHYSGGYHGGSRASRGTVARPRVQDHRGVVSPSGHRPYVHHGYASWPGYHRYSYWPYYYGYWPYYGYGYYGYYDRYGASYYDGAPGTVETATAAPPPPRSRLAVAAHLGQLERDDDAQADVAGIALRWRSQVLEGELELGRRSFTAADRVERTLGATLYANLGDRDAIHPYLLAGAGLLASDRVFGAVGAGLALPVASRLTLTGDVRAASIGRRDHHDAVKVGEDRVSEDRARTVEGRLSLVVDF